MISKQDERERTERVFAVFADGRRHAAGEVVERLGFARNTTLRYLRLLVEAGRLRLVPRAIENAPAVYERDDDDPGACPSRPLAECFGLIPAPYTVEPRVVRGLAMFDEMEPAQ